MSDTSNAFATGDQFQQLGGFDLSMFGSFGQSMDGQVKMEDFGADQENVEAKKQEPSSGPVRNTSTNGNTEGSNGEESSKSAIAAPVKSACTFCRSR
jgi:hypothetical protein